MIRSVYEVPPQEEEGGDTEHGGGGSAAWFAQMVREDATGQDGICGQGPIDFDAIGTVASAENECQALKWVAALLDRRIADLNPDVDGGRGGDSRTMSLSLWDAAFVQNADVYKRGQVRVLRSARAWVEGLGAKLRVGLPCA